MRCGALIGLAMLAQTSPVFAHAFLERASPPVGSEVTVSPPELSITFTEGVEPLFSTIAVHGANGAAIATGKPHVAPDSNRRLIVELPKLPPGIYTVHGDLPCGERPALRRLRSSARAIWRGPR